MKLIMLPGALCTGALFKHQLANIDNSIAVEYPLKETITEFAEAVLKQNQHKFNLFGLSFGGIIAMEIMRIAPEKVNKLILSNTNYKAEIDANKTRRFTEIHKVLNESLTIEQLVATVYYPNYFTKEAVAKNFKLDTVIAMAQDTGAEGLKSQFTALNNRMDYAQVLPTIKVPTLVITGANDNVCNVDRHLDIYKRIAGNNNAGLKIIENCSHLSTLEQPIETTNAIKNWLKN